MAEVHVGSQFTVTCGDGIVRKGSVIYVHPEHRFATLEFDGVSGKWRESFFLRHPEKEAHTIKDRNEGRHYSKKEDKIIADYPPEEAAWRLGRTKDSILRHIRFLRGRNAVHTR